MNQKRLLAAVWLPVAIATVPTLGACSSNDANSREERLCTPGAYVFCRCKNFEEGTKLCNDTGTSFQACLPCYDDGPQPWDEDGGEPFRDAGFSPIDAGPQPDAGKGTIAAACVDKLALVGGDAQGVRAAVYQGNNAFAVSGSTGPAVLSTPHLLPHDSTLVGVFKTTDDRVAGTKLGTSWSPPFAIGKVVTASEPSLTRTGTKIELFYLGQDGMFHQGTYGSNGWDEATMLAEPANGAREPKDRSAPSAASVGSQVVVAFADADGGLWRRTRSGATWGLALKIAGASAAPDAPTMVAMDGGAKDLLLVYTGTDSALHSVTRDASDKSWSAPSLVDDGARAQGSAVVAAMSGGRAILAYRGTNGHAYVSDYDPSRANPWNPPSEIAAGHEVAGTPSVAPSRCGAGATIAYAEKDGATMILRYQAGALVGPWSVAGMTHLDFVAVGER